MCSFRDIVRLTVREPFLSQFHADLVRGFGVDLARREGLVHVVGDLAGRLAKAFLRRATVRFKANFIKQDLKTVYRFYCCAISRLCPFWRSHLREIILNSRRT